MSSHLEHLSLEERKKESYKIFDDIAETYDLLNHLLSFGIDIIWRNHFPHLLPSKDHIAVLDLACGTGDLSITLAREERVSKVIGLDLSKEMIAVGREKIQSIGLEKKITMIQGDAQEIPSEASTFDFVTISFGIRNFPSPEKALQEIHRVLKSDGRVAIIEFSLPANFILRFLYLFYLRNILPIIGRLISKHSDAYLYLNKTIEAFPYGDKFIQMMNQANFKECRAIPLTFGVATIYVGERG